MGSMQHRRGLLFLAAFFASTAFAQTPEDAVRRVLSDYLAQNRVVGATVAILKTDGKSVVVSAGFQDREGKVAATANTRYRLGSISKPVAAMAALQLVQEGKLSLFANVGETVPEWPHREAGITLRHLLTHTSGIRHYVPGKNDTYFRRFTVAESLNVFKDDPLLFKPGERVSYSTHAFSLVARMVEIAGGKPFAEAIRDRIATPSGSPSLALEDRRVADANRSKLYSLRSDGDSVLETREEDISWKSGGGGMESSAPDLARFGLAALQGKLLDKQMTDFMFQPQVVGGLKTERGLGWDFSPFQEPAHGGAQQGCRTMLMLDRVNGTAYAIMTNTGGNHPIGTLSRAVVNAWGERKIDGGGAALWVAKR